MNNVDRKVLTGSEWFSKMVSGRLDSQQIQTQKVSKMAGYYKQVGAIKNLQCPLCAGDMCGCVDCMKRKHFVYCKSCAIEFRKTFGKAPTASQIKRVKAKLHKLGFWNKDTDLPMRQPVLVAPVWAQRIGGNN